MWAYVSSRSPLNHDAQNLGGHTLVPILRPRLTTELQLPDLCRNVAPIVQPGHRVQPLDVLSPQAQRIRIVEISPAPTSVGCSLKTSVLLCFFCFTTGSPSHASASRRWSMVSRIGSTCTFVLHGAFSLHSVIYDCAIITRQSLSFRSPISSNAHSARIRPSVSRPSVPLPASATRPSSASCTTHLPLLHIRHWNLLPVEEPRSKLIRLFIPHLSPPPATYLC